MAGHLDGGKQGEEWPQEWERSQGKGWEQDFKLRGIFEQLHRNQTYLLERSKGCVVENEFEEGDRRNTAMLLMIQLFIYWIPGPVPSSLHP